MSLSSEETEIAIKILESERNEIKPLFSTNKGYTYIMETMLGMKLSEFLVHLNNMAEKGYLSRKFYRKIPICPKCGSQRLIFHFVCPFCKSSDWQKGKAIQHMTPTCSYIGFENEFKEQKCPSCGGELKSAVVDGEEKKVSIPVNFRVFDVYYKCNSCKRFF